MIASTPDLPSMVAAAAALRRLDSRADLHEPGWAFWELRNLNMHRVVGLLRADAPVADIARFDANLRGVMGRTFKRSWWRGIAYGVVADVGPQSVGPDDLETLVDGRENSKGTMQWVVLVDGGAHKVTGVHTWVEGYLGPVYRAVLQSLAERRFQIESIMKDKDGVMRVLTSVADGQAMALTGRPAFREFQDPFARPRGPVRRQPPQ
jgi:hypothetical protein